MSITSTCITEPLGPKQKVPANPFTFGKDIQWSQPSRLRYNYKEKHTILFNKGRYFETSIYDPQLLKEVCTLTGFKPQHTNMIVESWDKMEDFVIAMNILGIYVEIDIDWI